MCVKYNTETKPSNYVPSAQLHPTATRHRPAAPARAARRGVSGATPRATSARRAPSPTRGGRTAGGQYCSVSVAQLAVFDDARRYVVLNGIHTTPEDHARGVASLPLARGARGPAASEAAGAMRLQSEELFRFPWRLRRPLSVAPPSRASPLLPGPCFPPGPSLLRHSARGDVGVGNSATHGGNATSERMALR